MADAVSLEGLEFEISSSTRDAIQNLDNLSQSLKNLKSAVDTNINSSIERFKELNKAISAVSENSPIHKMAESIEKISGISKLSNIKIPENLGKSISDSFSGFEPENLKEISDAVKEFDKSVTGDSFKQLSNITQNLSKIGANPAKGLPDTIRELSETIDNIPEGLSEKVNRSFSGFELDGLKKVTSSIIAFNKAIAGTADSKIGSAINDIKVALSDMGDKPENLGKLVSKIRALSKAGTIDSSIATELSKIIAAINSAGKTDTFQILNLTDILGNMKNNPAVAWLAGYITQLSNAIKDYPLEQSDLVVDALKKFEFKSDFKTMSNLAANIVTLNTFINSLNQSIAKASAGGLQVFENTAAGISKLNAVISTLDENALNNKITAVDKVFQREFSQKLAKSVESFPDIKLSSIADALSKMKGNDLYLSETFVNNLSLLNGLLRDEVDESSINKLHSIAEAFSLFKGVSEISIPKNFSNSLSNISAALKNIVSEDIPKLTAIGNALKGFKGLSEIKISSSLANQISKLSVELKKINETDINKLKKFALAVKELDSLESKKINLRINTSDIDKAKKSVSGLKYSLKDSFKDIGYGFKDIGLGIFKTITSIPKGIKQAFSGEIVPGLKNIFISPLQGIFKVTSGIFRLASSARALTPILTKAFTAPLKYAGKLSVAIGKSLLSPIQKVANRLKIVIAGFGKIIKLRAFRFIITSITSGIKEGIDNLYQFSKGINGEFAKSMDMLATSSLYFKNSIGTMVAPIINQLAPAIDILVDKIVDGTNKINQFLAQMTGATYWTKAVKYPKEYAEAVDDAKKSVQDFTMGFDELNIISDNSSSKSSDNLDYSKMFEIVDLQKNPWTEQLKNAIENGDWYGAGTLLGEKFNSVFQNIDYSGAGAELGTKINNAISLAKGFLDISDFETIGNGIASFLNSGFDKIDFYNLGSVLAGKWNILIDTVHGFVTEFKFAKFGEDLSTAVNGWFDTIDLNKAVEDLSLGLQGILDLTSSFLENTHFSEFGNKVGGALNKFIDDLPTIVGKFSRVASNFTTSVFDFLSSTLEGIDWEDSGEKLFDAIEELFTNVEWDKVSESFSEFIGSAIGAAFGLLLGFTTEATEAYSKIFDWLSSGEVDAGKEALDWSNEHVVKPLLKGIVTNLEGEGTWNDINDVIEEKGDMWDFWQGYGEYIYDQFHKAGEGANEYTADINTNKKATEKWWEFWEGYGAEVYDTVDGYWETAKTKFSEFVDSMETNGEVIYDNLEDLKKDFKNTFNIIKSKFSDAAKSLEENGYAIYDSLENLKSDLSLFKENWKAGWDTIKSNVSDAKSDINDNLVKAGFFILDFKENWSTGAEELKSNLSKSWDSIKRKVSDTLQPLFDTAKSNFENFKSNWIDGAETIKSTLSEKWDSVKDKVTETVNPLFDNAKSNFNDFKNVWVDDTATIKEKTYETWDLLKEKVSNIINPMWDTAKSNFSSFKSDWLLGWEDIKTSLSSKWNEIKNDASNVFSPIESSFKNGANAVIGFIEGMVNNVIFAFNEMGKVINSFTFDIPDWVPGIGGGSFGLNLPEWSSISLPRFDKGGFPNSGDLFFANENGRPEFVGSMGGRTAVANNDQITEGIYEAVYSAMMAVMSSQNNNGTPELNIYLDSKQIAATVEERRLTRGQQIFTGGVVNEY